jgi:carboxyl-terminal processing protease
MIFAPPKRARYTPTMPQGSLLTLRSRRSPSALLAACCAVLGGALSALGGCASAPAVAPRAAESPAILPLETFDAVWTTVRDQHFDATLNGVDWNAVRDELRPRAEAAASQPELRQVLDEMLATLGQSHFSVIPADAGGAADVDADVDANIDAGAVATESAQGAARTDSNASASEPTPLPPGQSVGVLGLDLASVEGFPTVTRVTPGRAAARAGVLLGWRLVSVNGSEIGPTVEGLRARLAELESSGRDTHSPEAAQLRMALVFAGQQLLTGPVGSNAQVVFEDASGTEQSVSLTYEASPLGASSFGNLPPFPVTVESQQLERPVEGGAPLRVGYLAFNIWMTDASDAIHRAVDGLRRSDGIVLDLRGNPGGVAAMSMGVAGFFTTDPFSLGSFIGRESSLEFRVAPRRLSAEGTRVRPYTRPLAILVDGRSASTSEIFAGGLQETGRARVFGETTAGMALPATAVKLPNGDVLLHAIADFATPKGVRIEGRGVVPDEVVEQRLSSLREGRDEVLEQAVAWIRTRTLEARAERAKRAEPAAANP